MTALYYIYRNLHLKDTFSIRLRGRVIDRLTNLIAHDVQFKVSQRGRLRVIQDKQKNVHAFAATETYKPIDPINVAGLTKVWYNPFKTSCFMAGDIPIYCATTVLFAGGQCYLVKE